MWLKQLNLSVILVSFGCLLTPEIARASDWRYGFSLGYGGAGLTEADYVGTAPTVVKRSEGPGVFSIFVDRLLSDRRTLGFEHSRGFRLGPFSTGVSFTGVTHRWYFFGAAPSTPIPDDGGSTILIKRFIPFIGVSAGFALADIHRVGDQVGNATGSGVYGGFRGGADYPIALGMGIRPEVIYNTTFMQSPTEPANLTEFAVQCGLYFYL